MRPVDFTPDQIIEAGLELQSAGRSITGFALRKIVGGGNPTRLKQVWEEYHSSQSVVESEPVAELPVEVAQQLAQVTEQLVSRLGAMAVDINDRAVKASERRVAEVVRAAGEQREQAERELADASQTVDDLEQQLDSAQEKCESLLSDLNQIKIAKQEQAVELAQLRERLAAVEKAAKEAAGNAAAQVKLLQGQLEEQRRLEQMAREREAQATGAFTQMEKQHLEDARVCQDLRTECQDLRTELRALSSSFAQSEAVSESRKDELMQLKQELKDVRSELKTANTAEATALGREQAALARIKTLETAARQAPARPPAKTVKPKTGDKDS
nr:Alpha-helical coiled coil protein [Pseudomonas syringae pv. actinidiae]